MAYTAKMTQAEELVEQFLHHHEKHVIKGHASPLERLERLMVKMTIEWLLTKYKIERR